MGKEPDKQVITGNIKEIITRKVPKTKVQGSKDAKSWLNYSKIRRKKWRKGEKWFEKANQNKTKNLPR